ncbi:MAG: alanine racemase [Deltaproteobacteria bacterium]|nr:alanine racemase [Deltaproteobacteria bacterium]
MMIRATEAAIDLGAIRHNLGVVRRAAPGQKVCAVVKANAYGHGLVEVSRALEAYGADWLAVALVEEGVLLREAGVRAPILVLGGAVNRGFAEMVEHTLVPVLFDVDQIPRLAAAAGGRRIAFHLKIDSGMYRLGVLPAELASFLAALAKYPNLDLDGLCTHFARADTTQDRGSVAEQLACFKAAHAQLLRAGHTPHLLHVANSSATLLESAAHVGMVRPGLVLYGLDPRGPEHARDLRPAMRWTTRPVRICDVPAGGRVSYGGHWTAARPSRIATLPVGYADGYVRALSGKAQVLVRGRRAPVVGTICMDLCMIDVTDISGVSLADEVVLMGAQGSQEIPAYELARWADTIPYEITCGVSDRVPRRHTSEAEAQE